MADLFKDKAQEWDKREMARSMTAALGKAMMADAALGEGQRVMDFGAGTGLIAGSVAPHVDHVVAVDISPAMLQALAAKPELQGKVSVVCQDILEQPLDDRFDRIVSAMAMHHVQDTRALLKTFAQHLKPGGRVALADLDREDGSFHPPEAEGVFHTGFDRDALGALLAEQGFEDVTFRTAHTIVSPTRSYPVFLVTATLGA